MCKLGRKIRGKSSFSLQTGALDEKGAAKRDQGAPWSGAAGVKMSGQIKEAHRHCVCHGINKFLIDLFRPTGKMRALRADPW